MPLVFFTSHLHTHWAQGTQVLVAENSSHSHYPHFLSLSVEIIICLDVFTTREDNGPFLHIIQLPSCIFPLTQTVQVTSGSLHSSHTPRSSKLCLEIISSSIPPIMICDLPLIWAQSEGPVYSHSWFCLPTIFPSLTILWYYYCQVYRDAVKSFARVLSNQILLYVNKSSHNTSTE